MKLDRLDLTVWLVLLVCMGVVALAAFFSDPARQPSQVAYLYPALAARSNVWLSDIDNPDAARQLTQSEYGVFDYDISQDGRWLAYAERLETGAVNLRLLDIPAGRSRLLVDCAAIAAVCTTPAFHPQGEQLAYQRADANGDSYGLTRIWLVDLRSASTAPLIADTQVVGHSAQWSADGGTVAFYSADATQPGILLYDLAARKDDGVQLRFIPSNHGTMGSLSPSGQQIIFPQLIFRDNQFYSHLQIADLASKDFANFTDANAPIDDAIARFSPDGSSVAIARRYTDERWTPGHQVYLRSLENEAGYRPVAYDAAYNSSYFRWNRAGDKLVMQRFPLQVAQGSRAAPEVWVSDIGSGQSQRIREDAYLPQWASG